MPTETLESQLATLLAIAWLLPLLGFAVEVFGGYWSNRLSKAAAYLAVGCIGMGFVCSVIAVGLWANATDWAGFRPEHHETAEHIDKRRQHHGRFGVNDQRR